MDHLRIEERNLIDRYVRGSMPVAERAEFEEHFVECAACQEQIEFARSFRQAVRESVAERAGSGWRWAALAAAACLAVALAASTVFLLQRQSARSELANLRRPPVVFGLSLSRNAAEPQTIMLPSEPRWMVFVAEIDAARYSRYRAAVVNDTGEELWSQDSIQPNSPDSISVAIPSSRLRPGTYALTVSGAQADGSSIVVAHFPLRLVAGK